PSPRSCSQTLVRSIDHRTKISLCPRSDKKRSGACPDGRCDRVVGLLIPEVQTRLAGCMSSHSSPDMQYFTLGKGSRCSVCVSSTEEKGDHDSFRCRLLSANP